MAGTVAEVMVAMLKASGVRRVYGIPGDSLNGFTDALRRDGGITWEHVRHEEAAGFAAAAEAALTGELAVCAGSCGPGNLHLINGLFDANRSNVPVLAIAAHIPATALPHAIGAQASQPGRQVVALSGDGGLAMLLGELLTLRQQQLPVKVVVFNNAALSFVELEMKAAGIITYGTDLDNPDFAGIARSAGLFGARVEKADELEDALQAAFGHDGPALVDVRIARQELSLPPKLTYGQIKGFTLYATRTVLSGEGGELIELARPTSGSWRSNNPQEVTAIRRSAAASVGVHRYYAQAGRALGLGQIPGPAPAQPAHGGRAPDQRVPAGPGRHQPGAVDQPARDRRNRRARKRRSRRQASPADGAAVGALGPRRATAGPTHRVRVGGRAHRGIRRRAP